MTASQPRPWEKLWAASTARLRSTAVAPATGGKPDRGARSTDKIRTAGGPRQAHGQQPKQPQANHGHPLTELGFRQAEAVQGNRPQGGKGSRFKIHIIWQRSDQVGWHNCIFGMHGEISAGAGHALPNREPLYPGAQCQ